VDDAVNQTLARSINTTLTTTLTLLAIFLFGGDTLKYFALALIIGFLTGAYSSIFIASTLLAWWRERSEQPGLATANDAPLMQPSNAAASSASSPKDSAIAPGSPATTPDASEDSANDSPTPSSDVPDIIEAEFE
jgi:hypothetical protein